MFGPSPEIAKKFQASLTPIGSVVLWGGLHTPEGWITCDGQDISKLEYPQIAETNLLPDGNTSDKMKLPEFPPFHGYRYIMRVGLRAWVKL
jgi:hypothetical protein